MAPERVKLLVSEVKEQLRKDDKYAENTYKRIM